MQSSQQEKIFLIINLSFFGDVLVTNTLCQNIKLNYPDAKIVFVVNKPFYEAAKYQYCVDDVIYFDKKGEHKGLFGFFKFIQNCKYKNKIYAAFAMYDNERAILLSYFLNARHRISGPSFYVKWSLTDILIERKKELSRMQDINGDFIRALTGENGKVVPIKYLTDANNDAFAQKLLKEFGEKEIIGLCTVGKHKENYLPVDTAVELIEKFNSENKTIFYFGVGKAANDYANELRKRGCVKFVDLTNATTIYQLANVMQLCKAVISIDTGTMHLSYATGRPTVCIFKRPKMIKKWAPLPDLYPHTVIIGSKFTAENIYQKTLKLLDKFAVY